MDGPDVHKHLRYIRQTWGVVTKEPGPIGEALLGRPLTACTVATGLACRAPLPRRRRVSNCSGTRVACIASAGTAASTATLRLPQAADRLSFRQSDRWRCEASSAFQPSTTKLLPVRLWAFAS